MDRKEKERPVRFLKVRTREELVQKKELLILFPRKGGRRRRVKWPRKTATWLRLCSSAKLQSS